MKSIILILGVASILTLGSCKKNWTCTCVDQSGNSTNTEINDETLLNARADCNSKSYNHTTLGVNTSESCSLQ